MILAVNGRADSVLMDAAVYEKHLQAANLACLLAPAEAEVAAGQTRSAQDFLKEFKYVRNIQG
ncbi:MAG: hypothetical protein WCP20_19250 [Desulfuromonadales bacterium]